MSESKSALLASRSQCASNLADLGALYQLEKLEHPGRSRHSGSAALLVMRSESGKVKFGDEEKFLCPGDPHVVFPRGRINSSAW